jgi:hypothetical protein
MALYTALDSPTMQGRWGLRGGALLAGGALALHQLSYLLAGDPGGGHAHSYIPLAAGLVIVLLLTACVGFVRTLVCAARGTSDEIQPPSFRALWPLVTAALLCVFGLQEWIESWVTPGHPAGVAHVAVHIGWQGLGLAVSIAALISLLLRGSHAAIVLLAKRHASIQRLRPAPGRGAPLPFPALRRLDVLAANRAGRAPPIASF